MLPPIQKKKRGLTVRGFTTVFSSTNLSYFPNFFLIIIIFIEFFLSHPIFISYNLVNVYSSSYASLAEVGRRFASS